MWIENGGISENEKQGPFDIVFESILFSISISLLVLESWNYVRWYYEEPFLESEKYGNSLDCKF